MGLNKAASRLATSSTPKPSRAIRLMVMLLDKSVFSTADMARELSVSSGRVESFRAGRVPMPLEQQLCLAHLMIQKAPRYVRKGHELLGQVRAALVYESHQIATFGFALSRR